MVQSSQLYVVRNRATSRQRELLGRRYNYGEKASLWNWLCDPGVTRDHTRGEESFAPHALWEEKKVGSEFDRNWQWICFHIYVVFWTLTLIWLKLQNLMKQLQFSSFLEAKISLSGPVVVGSALSEETKKEGRKGRRKEEGKRRGTGAKESKPRWSLNSSTRSGKGKRITDPMCNGAWLIVPEVVPHQPLNHSE